MGKTVLFQIASVLILGLLSCETEEPVGQWDDIIKLSTKEVNFSAKSSSVTITTEGTGWWVDEIGLDDDWNHDLNGIDTTQDNWLIEESEFTVERKNATEIHVSMTENQSTNQRTLYIGLQAGNYFDGITIVQSAN